MQLAPLWRANQPLSDREQVLSIVSKIIWWHHLDVPCLEIFESPTGFLFGLAVHFIAQFCLISAHLTDLRPDLIRPFGGWSQTELKLAFLKYFKAIDSLEDGLDAN